MEKDTNEILVAHSINKKRKLGLDLDKRPGEKRPNKYYWAKIDVQKAPNPKLNTPKAQTLKIPRKKYGKKVVDIPVVPKHVLRETKKDPICKKALNYEKSEKTNLEDGKVNVILKQANVVPFDDNEGEKLDKNKGAESLKVYRRTLKFKCFNYCRKMGPNFLRSCKKRARRNRKPIGDLKPFKQFNYCSILRDFLDRITMMKGKTRMLLPMKTKIIREPFKCILSILSSSVKLGKKRRSVRKLTSIKNDVNILVIPRNTVPICYTSAVKFLGGDNDGGSLSDDIQKSFAQHKGLGHETSCGQATERLASSCHSTLNVSLAKESKTNEKGKKSRGPYKRKEKHKDYLSEITDWHDKALEPKLDSFFKHLQSLKLYDDPKNLERWSIMVSDQSNQGDGAPDSSKEDTQLFYARIARFLSEMTNFQGRKDFVKWNGSVLDSVVGVFLTQNVCDVLSSNAYMLLASRFPLKPINQDKDTSGNSEIISCQGSPESTASTVNPIVELPPDDEEETSSTGKEYDAALKDMLASLPDLQGNKGKEKKGDGTENFDWEALRVHFSSKSTKRRPGTEDSVDWEGVRNAPVKHIADTIESRGQHRIIAAKIQKVLNRLVDDHKTLDLEWLRDVPPEVAKAYLLSFYGLGLKSVECLRLLTLHHHGFPVDVNIARISIRLGWVPLKPLPVGLPFHLLQKYPLENDIQQYLWPRLRHLKQEHLYRLHYQMITFGKVFCLKKNPNCRACPFKNECKYYKSLVDSLKLKHPHLAWTQDKRMIKSKKGSRKRNDFSNPFAVYKESSKPWLLPATASDPSLDAILPFQVSNHTPNSHICRTIHTSPKCEHGPIIEHPASPKKVEETDIPDIEDLLKDEAGEEFIVVKLKSQEFKQTLPNPYEENYVHPGNDEFSRALVSLSPEYASLPLPKHINPVRLRTEHQVYELPYDHPLLKNLDRQQGKVPYLLAIWTQGQNEEKDSALKGSSEKACSSNNVPDDSLTVPGTLLIPVRTAMKGSFPLNGTYFQVNEVFADDETSEHPINVPRRWIWRLPKRTLYCGSGTSSVFRGLTVEEIRRCCWEGYICTRGFDRQTRAPKSLPLKFHNRPLVKGKLQDEEDD